MGGIDITSQVLNAEKTNRYLSVTKKLSNCALDNGKSRVIEGQGYGATITANQGYTLDSGTVTITMGGVDMSAYYSNGKIAIPNVTGDIVITATAVTTAGYINLADPTSDEWQDGYRISSSGVSAQSGKTVSNPIDVVVGDVVRVKGVDFVANTDRYLLTGKNSAGTALNNIAYISNLPNETLGYSLDTTPAESKAVIITKNEEIN